MTGAESHPALPDLLSGITPPRSSGPRALKPFLDRSKRGRKGVANPFSSRGQMPWRGCVLMVVSRLKI